MVSGASWIRRGSYSKRMRCLSRYLANITSKLDRKVNRFPPTLTCQLYLRLPIAFSLPKVAPDLLDISLVRQPQDLALSRANCDDWTDTTFPQSHSQRQYTRLQLSLLSSTSIAVSLPNFFPVKFMRLSTALQRLHLGIDGPCKVEVPRDISLPQSHRHIHVLMSLRRITVSVPKRMPVRSVVPNSASRLPKAWRQPHDAVSPLCKPVENTTVSLPHSHRQRQVVYRPFLPAYSITVSLPNTCPVKSLSWRPRFLFSITRASNNNAPFACPAKLPRRRIQQKRRSYQYSTRARRLGTYSIAQERF